VVNLLLFNKITQNQLQNQYQYNGGVAEWIAEQFFLETTAIWNIIHKFVLLNQIAYIGQ